MYGYYHINIGLLLHKITSSENINYYEAKDVVIYLKEKSQYIILSGGNSGMILDSNDSEYQILKIKEIGNNLMCFLQQKNKEDFLPSYYYQINNCFIKITNNDLINHLKEKIYQEEKILFLDDYRRRFGS